MTIRFLQVCESGHPDFPFQVGQVITVPHLTEFFQACLQRGDAVPVPAEDEVAVAPPPPEVAVVHRRRKRR